MRRSHSWAAATRPGRRARPSEMARDAGFDNIGIDLIYGLPGQSELPTGRSPSRRPSPSGPITSPATSSRSRRARPSPRGAAAGRSLFPTMTIQADLFFATSRDPRRKRLLFSTRSPTSPAAATARIAAQQQILGPYPLSRPRPGGPFLRRPAGARWNVRSVDAYLQRACRGTPARCGVGAADPGPVTHGGPLPRFSDKTGA